MFFYSYTRLGNSCLFGTAAFPADFSSQIMQTFLYFFGIVYCLDPPVVQHATHNGRPEASSFPLETVLKYACYPGYVTVGFAHAKCFLYNDTAQWFGPDITCKGVSKALICRWLIHICFNFLAIRCSDPDPIENGDVERKCQTFGCRISYKCRAGYELDGRQHRYCQADGSWSPRILPQCVRKFQCLI